MVKTVRIVIGLIMLMAIAVVAMIPFVGMICIIRFIDYWLTDWQIAILTVLSSIPSFVISERLAKKTCDLLWHESDDNI